VDKKEAIPIIVHVAVKVKNTFLISCMSVFELQKLTLHTG
jgi:hypothetical protein